jgi:hypothetical protein
MHADRETAPLDLKQNVPAVIIPLVMTHERTSIEPSWSRSDTVVAPAYAAAQASYILKINTT